MNEFSSATSSSTVRPRSRSAKSGRVAIRSSAAPPTSVASPNSTDSPARRPRKAAAETAAILSARSNVITRSFIRDGHSLSAGYGSGADEKCRNMAMRESVTRVTRDRPLRACGCRYRHRHKRAERRVECIDVIRSGRTMSTAEGQAPGDEPSGVSRREAAIDTAAVIVLVPLCAVGAGIVVALFSSGTPHLAAALFAQALLVLGGVYLLLSVREQGFEQIGLRAPCRADLGRAVIVVLAGFGVNLLLTLAAVALSPGTLEDHIAGLETLAIGLTEDTPIGAMVLLLLLVGFYEEIVARGLLLTRARELFGGYWTPALISSALFALGHF